MNKLENVVIWTGAVALVVGLFFFSSWLLMLVLGALLPTFGLATVSFWQSVGIKLVAVLLVPNSAGAKVNN